MKEIERAINLISEGEIDYSGIYDCELNERVTEVILNALREKSEREVGCRCCTSCDYCKNSGRPKCYDDCSEGTKKHFSPKHTFCPNCGKRLEVEHELSDM